MTDLVDVRRNERVNAQQWARDWVAALPGDQRAELTVAIVAKADAACQEKLTAGREDIFVSVRDCRPEFDAVIEAWRVQGLPVPPLGALEQQDACFSVYLDQMRRDGDVVFVSDRQRIRSRAFEVVHYLRNLKQRMSAADSIADSPRLVDMVKVEVLERERPIDAPATFNAEWFTTWESDEIDGDVAAEVLGFDDFADLRDDVDELFRSFLARAFRAGTSFRPFQKRAFEALLASALAPGPSPTAHVVAAPTGFGKTEAFLLPILYYSLCRLLVRTRRRTQEPKAQGVNGVDALLIYPRRDLCDNQAERLLRYLYALHLTLESAWQEDWGDYEPLTVALAHGGVGAGWRLSCPACAQDFQALGQEPPPDAVLVPEPVTRPERFRCIRGGAAHETAAGLLIHQLSSRSAQPNLAITTLDTLHRRVLDSHGRIRLFERKLSPPRFVVVDEMHIYEGQVGSHAAQVLRRARQRVRDRAGRDPVLVGASATVGTPVNLARRVFGVEDVRLVLPEDAERRRSGLEYFFFLQSPGNRRLLNAPQTQGTPARTFVSEQATMIQVAFCLQHAMKAPSGDGVRKRRVLGFVDSLDLETRLARNIDDAEWKNLCGSPTPNSPLYLLRHPRGRPDSPAVNAELRAAIDQHPSHEPRRTNGDRQRLPVFGHDCPKALTRDCHQPPHHMLERCSRYEEGECWYTIANQGEEGLRPLLVQKHRSGGREWGDPDRGQIRDADRDAWRLLISTSALEVGFDHPELIATWQWHAPRNVSSFIQRKGRGGRGVRDYPITAVVLGPSSGDTAVFQDHLRWVRPQDVDYTTILDEENPSVCTQHLVAAVFDYCAARTNGDAYYLEPRLLLEPLRSTDLQTWVYRCFKWSPAIVSQRLMALARVVSEVWLAPLDWTGIVPAPRNLQTPPDLFRRNLLSHDDAVRLELDVRRNPASSQVTRLWLSARLAADFEAPDDPVHSMVDFCKYVPQQLLADPTVRLPDSISIPVPLGRWVQLIDRQGQPVGTDPAEAALQYFLPGGFKIRYQGHQWMAPWRAVSTIRPTENLTWVSASQQIVGSDRDDLALTNCLAESAADLGRRNELLALLGADCHLRQVRSLEVEDLGRHPRGFFLHLPTLSVVRSREPGTNPSDYEDLPRDPHVTSLSELLPRRNPTYRLIRLGGLGGLVDGQARAYDVYEMDKVHYANLVTCYREGAEARTIVLRFWDEVGSRPLAPTIRLSTQALEFVMDWEAARIPPPTAEQLARRFWTAVSEEIVDRCLLASGELPSIHLVEPLAEFLHYLELRSGEFLAGSPTLVEMRRRVEAASPELSVVAERAWCLQYMDRVMDVLDEARQRTGSEGLRTTLGETLASAIARAAARDLEVARSSLRTHVECDGARTRVVLFDDLEGGSGTIRRLAQEWHQISDLGQRIRREGNCPAALADAAVAMASSGAWAPDSLSVFARSGSWPAEIGLPDDSYLRQRVVQRLAPLFVTPELAAFTTYAGTEWQELRSRFNGEPSVLRFLEQIRRSPALDPRAEALRRRFMKTDEIRARARAVVPLCVTACAECLIEDRFDGRERDLDRRLLLSGWAEGSQGS